MGDSVSEKLCVCSETDGFVHPCNLVAVELVSVWCRLDVPRRSCRSVVSGDTGPIGIAGHPMIATFF